MIILYVLHDSASVLYRMLQLNFSSILLKSKYFIARIHLLTDNLNVFASNVKQMIMMNLCIIEMDGLI